MKMHVLAAAVFLWGGAAYAQDNCGPIRAVSQAAPSDFSGVRGAMRSQSRVYTSYEATSTMPNARACWVSVSSRDGRASYTCEWWAPPSVGVQQAGVLAQTVSQCLGGTVEYGQDEDGPFAFVETRGVIFQISYTPADSIVSFSARRPRVRR